MASAISRLFHSLPGSYLLVIGHENRFMLRVLVVDESRRLVLRLTRGIPGLELIHLRPRIPSDHPIISPIPRAFGARESAALPDVVLLLEVRYCPEKWGPFHNVPRRLMGLMKVGWLIESLHLFVSGAVVEARNIIQGLSRRISNWISANLTRRDDSNLPSGDCQRMAKSGR